MNLEEVKKLVQQKKLPPDRYKGKIRCRATGRTGTLRYWYAKNGDQNNMIAVIMPDNMEFLLYEDEITPENLEML